MKNSYRCDQCGCYLDPGEGLLCDECRDRLRSRDAAARRISETVSKSDFGQIEMKLQEA